MCTRKGNRIGMRKIFRLKVPSFCRKVMRCARQTIAVDPRHGECEHRIQIERNGRPDERRQDPKDLSFDIIQVKYLCGHSIKCWGLGVLQGFVILHYGTLDFLLSLSPKEQLAFL